MVEGLIVGIIASLLASAVIALTGLFRRRTLQALKSLVPRLKGDHVGGAWKLRGSDLIAKKIGFDYTEPMSYTGDAQITPGIVSFELAGNLISTRNSRGKVITEQWALTGRGVREGEHLLIVYRLSHARHPDTIGCLFLRLDTVAYEANGYFLAKRVVPGEKKNKLGIALGEAVFERVDA